jgi:predicted ATP-grasp superfamily ATP-dependent carboligase
MTTVLVSDAGRGSSIAIIRSLGRHGLRVIAADHDPRSPGFRSRYAAERLVHPDPAADPAAVVEALHERAAASGVDLIVPVSDEVLLPLAAARERFAGLAALAIPDGEALAQAADKGATLRLARALGVPLPRTAVARTAGEALAAAGDLGWPVVLKPAVSRLLRDGRIERFEVAYAADPEGVAAAMARVAGRCEVLVQEHLAGEGHGVELLADGGRALMAFQHRRLHEVPITGGASALRESVPLDAELLGHATRLLGALRWTGLAMVEFRVGPGGPALMEINGRVWGSLPLAVKCGVDFPLGLVAVHLGAALPPARAAALGVRSRNLGLELVWIASVMRRRRRYPFLAAPGRGQAVAAAVRLPLPGDGYDVLAVDDPAPGLADTVRAFGRVLRKVGHAT